MKFSELKASKVLGTFRQPVVNLPLMETADPPFLPKSCFPARFYAKNLCKIMIFTKSVINSALLQLAIHIET